MADNTIPEHTTNDSKKWSDLETRKLITLYEENELLWNVTLTDYRNRVKKHEALRDISLKLRIDVFEVQRKLHNLRSQYNSELKKLKKISSGQATDEVYVSNWPYFAALKFINVKAPTTSSNLAMKEKKSNYETVGELESEDESIAQSSIYMTDLQEETETEIKAPPAKKKNIKPSQDMPLYVQQAVRQLNQNADDEQVFGDFCASELRQIKKPANKRMFKRIVMEAITNIGEAEAMGLIYTPYSRSFDVPFSVPSAAPSPSPGSRGSSEGSSPYQVQYHGQPTNNTQQQQQLLPLEQCRPSAVPSPSPGSRGSSGCSSPYPVQYHGQPTNNTQQQQQLLPLEQCRSSEVPSAYPGSRESRKRSSPFPGKYQGQTTSNTEQQQTILPPENVTAAPTLLELRGCDDHTYGVYN